MRPQTLKSALFMFILSLFLNTLSAQKPYFSFNLGYSYGMGSENIYNVSGSYPVFTYEKVNLSYGKGVNAELCFGYRFNKNIRAQFGISYLVSDKTKIKEMPNFGSILLQERTMSATMYRFFPSIIVSTGFERFDPYAKFGLAIGTGVILDESKYYYINDLLERTWEYSGGVGIGINASMGVTYKLSQDIELFTELNTINMSYGPTKGRLIKSNINGLSQLDDLDTYLKEIEFYSNFTDDDTQEDENQPNKQIKVKYPFGSIGINFGCKIGL